MADHTQVVLEGDTGAPRVQQVERGPFAFVAGRQQVVIKQRFELGEACLTSLGCGCCEGKNSYQIFDGESGEELGLVQEDSGCCCRCCFKPNHKADLHVYDVTRGDKELVMEAEKPCKCNCVALFGICRREIIVKDAQGAELAHADTPCCGGCLHPKLEIKGRDSKDIATAEGPCCCIGGSCAELCCSYDFDLKRNDQEWGKIVKQKPRGLRGKLKEAAGDSDTYRLEFGAGATPEEAAALIATAILLDYSFYENDGCWKAEPDGSCTTNCWTCYCCGCVCPCVLRCGGTGSPEDASM